MWPILLDMTKDECRRTLRRLELEAYGSVVTALRAQGGLGTDKQKVLKEIATSLNISAERHRAEVRRAVNDEKLATIAHCMTGDDTTDEWATEGRRLVPLMARIPPQTAYSVIADDEANKASLDNDKLPAPATTERKRLPSHNIVTTDNSKMQQYRINTPTTAANEIPVKYSGQNAMQEEMSVKKRRMAMNVESSSLAQHLMMTQPRISRLQQIYRQKSRTVVKTTSKQRLSIQAHSQIPQTVPVAPEEIVPKPVVPPVVTVNENQQPKQKPVTIPQLPTAAVMPTPQTPLLPTSQIQHPPDTPQQPQKTIKICPARKIVTSTSTNNVATTTQKVMIVSNSQNTTPVVSTSSILQRTLTIPFVKTISMKNLDKVKITSSISTTQKPKLLTVQAKMKTCTSQSNAKTVSIPFIQGMQLQALHAKGAIKMLPLPTPPGEAKNIIILKNEQIKQPNNLEVNKTSGCVLANIMKASGISNDEIESTEVELGSHDDIESEITQFTQINKCGTELASLEQVGQSNVQTQPGFVVYSNRRDSNEERNRMMEVLGELDPETGLYALKEQTIQETEVIDNYVVQMEQEIDAMSSTLDMNVN